MPEVSFPNCYRCQHREVHYTVRPMQWLLAMMGATALDWLINTLDRGKNSRHKCMAFGDIYQVFDGYRIYVINHPKVLLPSHNLIDSPAAHTTFTLSHIMVHQSLCLSLIIICPVKIVMYRAGKCHPHVMYSPYPYHPP